MHEFRLGCVSTQLTNSSTPRRSVAWVARTALLTLAAVLLGLVSIGQLTAPEAEMSGPMVAWAFLGFCATVAQCVLLWFRARWPARFTIITAILAIGTPTTSLPAAVGLFSVVQRSTARRAWLAIGLVTVATFAVVLRDAFADQSFLTILAGEPANKLPAGSPLLLLTPLIALAAISPFVLVGYVLRGRKEREVVTQANVALVRSTDALQEQASRERERAAVSREIHDTLASRLSELSLTASALELRFTDTGDDEAARALKSLRESAQGSMDDLNHVVHLLRDPTSIIEGGKTLLDLRALLDEAIAQGDHVRSSILVDSAERCPPALAHVVYRFVQEALVNARKHAPGAPVTVTVFGVPGTGFTITIENAKPGTHAPSARAMGDTGEPRTSTGGHGLLGMRERVESVGGRLEAMPTETGGFIVSAQLPWPVTQGEMTDA